jgi:DNA polymerase-3 subunit alpha
METDFVHLNFHSEYSLLESCCHIDRIQSECNRTNNRALALTDSGNISGAVKFFKDCGKDPAEGNSKVKPILGSKFSLCPNIDIQKERDFSPLILLAKDDTGFGNIKNLSHISHVDGFYYKPRIDYNLLENHSDGLICISTGMNGSVQRLARRGKMKEAKAEAEKFKNLFGDDYYLEIQMNNQVDQDIVAKNILQLGKEMDIDVIATNDVRYFKQSDHKAHMVLKAIRDKKTIDSDKFTAIRTDQRYLKSPEEMKEAFKDYPVSVLHKTVEIAEKCNLEIKFGGMRLPEYDLPEGFETDSEYLRHLAFEGLKKRGLHDRPEYVERLEEELFDVYMVNEVRQYNFARYFLLVWDYVNHAQSNGCRIGIGRGSACGSLLLYTLYITNMDPIKYGLHWWRFLTVDKGHYIEEGDFF